VRLSANLAWLKVLAGATYLITDGRVNDTLVGPSFLSLFSSGRMMSFEFPGMLARDAAYRTICCYITAVCALT
jgi:hypothetical protein